MNRFLKKALLICSLGMLSAITVAGCGKKERNQRVIDKNCLYKEESIAINAPEGISINSVEIKDDKFVGIGNDENYKSCWVDGNFTDGSVNVHTVPDENEYLENVYFGPDETYIVISDSYEEISTKDEYEYKSYVYLSKYASDGSLLDRKEMGEELGIEYIGTIYMLPDDRMLICSDRTVYLIDSAFKLVSKKEIEDESIYSVDSIGKTKAGQMYVSFWGEENLEYRLFNLDTLEIGDPLEVKVPLDMYTRMPGTKFDLMLLDTQCMYGYNFGDETTTKVIDFIDSDIYTSYFSSFDDLGNDTYVGAAFAYDEMTGESKLSVSKYTKIDPGEYVEKEIITLGWLWPDDSMKSRVINFNKSNDKYKITIVDYSQYETEDDWDAGLKKLNSDIASGNAPDIVVSSDHSVIQNYASKGMFMDLIPLIEADAEIELEDIFPNIREATSIDGKMYEMIPSFTVQTLLVRTDMLDGRTHWNFKEMMDFEKSLPEGTLMMPATPREDFLYQIFAVSGNRFIDPKSGKCSFNTDEFKNILEYAKGLPEGSEDYYEQLESSGIWDNYDDLWRSKRAVLFSYNLSSLREYNNMLHAYFDAPVTFIGFPCEEGNGSALCFTSAYGISSKCKNPEAAWDFLRYYYTQDYLKSSEFWGFPASIKAFDEAALNAQKKEDPNNAYWYYSVYDPNGGVDPITAEECERVKQFIMTVDTVEGSLDDVTDIIDEETQAYYSGQKSLDEVVQVIQSRATVFMNEKQ